MKRKLLTLVFIVSGLMPAIAQNVSDLKTEKDMDISLYSIWRIRK